MNIYYLKDNDQNEPVLTANDSNEAIRSHCALFGMNQDQVNYKRLGGSLNINEYEVEIILSKP